MSASPLPIRAFQWDLARQVERLDWLLEQLPRYADWGYQELYLHLEDAVEYPSLPQVARHDAYSYAQFERLVKTATKVGIGVVPIVNLLGHTQYLIKVPALRELNELRAADGSPLAKGQICPLHPRTLEVAEKLLRDMQPFCTTGKVHVGLDESFHLGKHPLSRAEVTRIGLPAHFARYVGRLHALTQSLHLRTGLWADMLYFLPEAIALLPRDLIAYDWYYYPFRRWPKVEFYNFAERDLAAPLRRQGIEYWGCPMNGSFRFEPMPIFGDRLANLRSWWRRCRETKAHGFLVTSWESSRLAQETTTMVDAAAASLWLDTPTLDNQAMLARGVQRQFGLPPSQATSVSRSLLQQDAAAFTGYARWEINHSWSQPAGSADLSTYRHELQLISRRLRAASQASWPPALASTCAFRLYHAQRDVFVREGHVAIAAMRRALARGRKAHFHRLQHRFLRAVSDFDPLLTAGWNAARQMWSRTRIAPNGAPNLKNLRMDRAQLGRLRNWLHTLSRNPALIWQSHPLGGDWQLTYAVWNFAPAVQQVEVQQYRHGNWETLKACHTIEFSSIAAVGHSRVVRCHSVPITLDKGTKQTLRLRFLLRGVGAVRIGRICLTDGIRTLRPLRSPPLWRQLGPSAPKQGFPNLGSTDVLALPTLVLDGFSI